MNRKVFAAVGLGAFLQFYNLYLTSYFIMSLAMLFFPMVHKELFYFMVLIAYISIRFLSSFYFGPIGDQRGRKKMLVLSMLLMAAATFLIGLIPSQQYIGAAATILFIFFRLVQGFALGGEFGGAVSLLIEYAPEKKRGLYASWVFFTSFLGILFALLLTSWFYAIFSVEFINAWGWRILFLLGIVLVWPAIYLRTSIPESPVFSAVEPLKHPMKHLFSSHGKEVLLGIGVCIGPAVVGGFNFIFLPTFFIEFVGLSHEKSFLLLGFATLIFLIFIPLMGSSTDKMGRKFVFYWGSAATAILAWPLFHQIQYVHPWVMVFVLFFYGFFAACMYGAFGAFLAELFPTKVRCSGFSLAFNLGGTFVSLIPLFALYSIRYYSLYSASLLVSVACLITILSLYFSEETAFRPLKED